MIYKKFLATTVVVVLSAFQVQAAKVDLSVEETKTGYALRVVATEGEMTLSSFDDSELSKKSLDACIRDAYPANLPALEKVGGWLKMRETRRLNLSPYHLYAVKSKTATLGFIDLAQMPIAGYDPEKFPAIVKKWKDFGVLDDEGKPRAGAGLASILPIFAQKDVDEATVTSALRLSTSLLEALRPYFSLPSSATTTPRSDLPKDWKDRLAWVSGKLGGDVEKESEESKKLFFDLSKTDVLGVEMRRPYRAISLVHPADPKLFSFAKADFEMAVDDGFKAFYDAPRVLASWDLLK